MCSRTLHVLQIPLPDVVAMQTRQASLEGTGEITLRHLVKEALRMRPNRIIVGEVRQQEALDLLIALNSGLPGMGTVHANSAREAITKMCTLPLLAGDSYPKRFRRRGAPYPCWFRDGCDVCAEVLVSHEMAWSDQRGQGSVRDWASSTIRRSLTRGGTTRVNCCANSRRMRAARQALADPFAL